MTAEQKFFIRILADHIHGKRSDPGDASLNWDKLADYAGEQALSGLVYAQLKNFFQEHPDLAPETAKRLHREFCTEVYLYANRRAELEEVSRKCGETPLLLMKGSVVNAYYPVPVFRSMGDVDLVIHTADRQKTDAVMLEEGYSKMVDNHAVWTYEKDHIQFEIHDHMFYEHLANDVDYRGYFDRVWEYARRMEGTENLYVPSENFHFLYLVTHLAKHIINKGMGFRTFVDLVFMTQKVGEKMDWQWIQGELKKLKLLEFTKTCFAFCKRWFDVQMPLKTAVLDINFYSEVTAKMFNDGIFGLENSQNEAAYSAKEIKRSNVSYLLAAVRLTAHQLFPPYSDMQLVSWYRFVDGRPWLLPAAWVYRWLYVATHKFKHGKDLLTEPFCKREVIEKRKKMISGWGL